MLKPSELLKNTLGLLNTPGNIITAIILFCGAVATVMRFGWGIGAVTNLDDQDAQRTVLDAADEAVIPHAILPKIP